MTSPTVHVPVLLNAVLEGCGIAEDARTDSTTSSDVVADAPNPATIDPSQDSSASDHPLPSSSLSSASRSLSAPERRILVDGTLGGGGHAIQMADRLGPGDLLIGIDRDPAAVERFRTRLQDEFQRETHAIDDAWKGVLPSGCDLLLECGSYCDLPEILARHGLSAVSAILLDLGLSSDQLQDPERGFSFRSSGPLDLRFDPTRGISAAELLQRRSEEEIANIIYRYGEERFSRRIARAIVERRRTQPVETSEELADLVHRCVPGRVHGRVDSATRTFQALRIAVNSELEHVERAMNLLPGCLSVRGRIVIISFHSLEDRIVKHSMRGDPRLQVLTKKPIEADEEEVRQNPRSRSAKLRIAERRDDAAPSKPRSKWS